MAAPLNNQYRQATSKASREVNEILSTAMKRDKRASLNR